MEHLTPLRLMLMLCTALFALACENDAPHTQIRVIVDSDLVIGTELTRLEVRVYDRRGQTELRRQDFALAPERDATRYTLPMSFKLAPDSQRSTGDFRLVVTGVGPLGPGGSEVTVVEQQALASFRPGESLRLDVFLGRSCLLTLCRNDTDEGLPALTCDVATGACVEVPLRSDLPTASGDGLGQYVDSKDAAASVADADAQARDYDGSLSNDALDASRDGELPDESGTLDAAAEKLEAGAEDVGTADRGDGKAMLDGLDGIAVEGAICNLEGRLACAGHDSSVALRCLRGLWEVRAICEGSSRCDTRQSGTSGTCQPIDTRCLGHVAGERWCDGTLIRSCGLDRTDSFFEECGAHQRCDPGAIRCECAEGYRRGLSGGCEDIDDCTNHRCEHGGRCLDGVASYSCDCRGTGYEGAFCEVETNECALPNSCTSGDYPCAETDPPGYICLGQMADWPMPDAADGAKQAAAYDQSTGGIVKDLVTGLWWQAGDDTNFYSWVDAKRYCEMLVLDSKSDWRMPSKIELESIVDFTRRNPAINPAFSAFLPQLLYWSASSNLQENDAVWVVDFADGRPYRDSKKPELGGVNKVRCVRSHGRRPSGFPVGRYEADSASGTTRDRRTGLTWQTTADNMKRSLSAATTYCKSRGAGWRLPTLKELLTLSDPTTSPSINTQALSTVADWFASSTLLATDATQSWAVLFSWPYTAFGPNDEPSYVRCVK